MHLLEEDKPTVGKKVPDLFGRNQVRLPSPGRLDKRGAILIDVGNFVFAAQHPSQRFHDEQMIISEQDSRAFQPRFQRFPGSALFYSRANHCHTVMLVAHKRFSMFRLCSSVQF